MCHYSVIKNKKKNLSDGNVKMGIVTGCRWHMYIKLRRKEKKDLAEQQSLLANADLTRPVSTVAWQQSLVCSADGVKEIGCVNPKLDLCSKAIRYL